MDQPFVSYEYTRLPLDHRDLHFLLDCYEQLGWEQDTRPEGGKTLVLRRSRKSVNHVELTRLQAHLESCLAQMETLEKTRGARATAAALTAGILGAALMALSVFALTARPHRILLSILLGLPALALWALAPLIHRRLYAKHSAAAEALILRKREEICGICEKAGKLL